MSGRELVERRLAHDDAIHALAFLPTTPPLLSSGGIDETIKLWTITPSDPSLTSPTSTILSPSTLACISITPSPLIHPPSTSPCLFWSSFLDGTIRSFTSASSSFLHSIPSTPSTTFTVSHHPTLPLLATAGSSGAVTIFKLKPSSSPLPSTDQQKSAESKEIHSSALTWPCDLPATSASSFAYSITFSPSGQLIATGHHSGAVNLYETSSSKLLHTFTPHSAPVRALAFSSDESLLYTGGDDGMLGGLDVQSRQQVVGMKVHDSFVTGVVEYRGEAGGGVGPSQRMVVTSGVEGRVKVWDMELRESVHVYEGTAPVWTIAKHPTEKWIAVGSEDATLKLLQVP